MRAADLLALPLAGTYRDPVTGELLAAEARSVVIADSLAGDEVEFVAPLVPGPRLALIADRATHAVLGEGVARALAGPFDVEQVILDAPHADAATVARLAHGIDPRTDAVIAVGSETINDPSKMIALERACPQLVVVTAPSMNGYTSVSASITSDGVRPSVRARTPVGVFFDPSVLAAAPPHLIRAGRAYRRRTSSPLAGTAPRALTCDGLGTNLGPVSATRYRDIEERLSQAAWAQRGAHRPRRHGADRLRAERHRRPGGGFRGGDAPGQRAAAVGGATPAALRARSRFIWRTQCSRWLSCSRSSNPLRRKYSPMRGWSARWPDSSSGRCAGASRPSRTACSTNGSVASPRMRWPSSSSTSSRVISP